MPNSLTPAQSAAYNRDGVYFPIPVLTPDETKRYRAAFEDFEQRLGGHPKATELSQTHLQFPWAYELATHSAVLDAVEDVLGPDVLVWTTNFFPKRAHDPGYISWHQDGTYWGLDSSEVTTAWIALTGSTVENGCMRVVPGSQKLHIIPHRETHAANNMLTRGQEVERQVSESEAVDVVLRPGEMSLHHVNIIHGSNPNPSEGRRIGFAIRYITPKASQVGERQPAVLARGRDEYHHFDLLTGPPTGSIEEGIAAHRERARRLLAQLTSTRGHFEKPDTSSGRNP